jgi:hypothetical protein
LRPCSGRLLRVLRSPGARSAGERTHGTDGSTLSWRLAGRNGQRRVSVPSNGAGHLRCTPALQEVATALNRGSPRPGRARRRRMERKPAAGHCVLRAASSVLTRPSRASARPLTVPRDSATREEALHYKGAKCGKNRSCGSPSLPQRSTLSTRVPFSAFGEIFRRDFAGRTNADSRLARRKRQKPSESDRDRRPRCRGGQ